MHHSSTPDPEMTGKLREAFSGLDDIQDVLGATGRFPGGQLTELDEGEITFRIAFVSGKVVLDWGKPITWVGMSTEQAKDLARDLMKYANPVTRPRG